MPISSKGMRLLLDLLEAKSLIFTRATISSFHGSYGEELIQSGMLVPNGYERAVTATEDDEHGPMSVEFDDWHAGLGYHSAAEGWVPVQQAELQLYRPDVDRLFRTLLGGNLRAPAGGITEVEAGSVWEIGSARVAQTKSSVIWFARRLSSREDSDRLAAACNRRPWPGLRLVLTSTPYERLPTTPLLSARVISIADVLSASAAAEIDFEILKARYAGTPTEVITAPLHLSVDGRILTIHGQTEIRFGGKIQRVIIRLLFQAHEKGQQMRAEDLLTRSGSGANSLDQAFGTKWIKLKPFLKSEGGLWRFSI